MDSPVGGLRLHADAGLLTRISFDARPIGEPVDDPVLDLTERQLAEYFAGERREFDVPIAADGTEFQRKVWAHLRTVEYGATVSYGQVATDLGYEPGISRAVGAAAGANPLAIVVPCHRVVGADGSLTGYAGGVQRKAVLLDLERPGLF